MSQTTITLPPAMWIAREARAGQVLQDQVYDLLAELALNRPDTIAFTLADAELRGLPGTLMHPLCRWLLDRLDDQSLHPAHQAWMSNAGVHVLAQDGAVEAVVALPPPVATFAEAWERGEYPELQLDIPNTAPLVVEPVFDDPALAQCVACGCMEAAACVTELPPVNGQYAWTVCRWATPDEIAAAGYNPTETGDLCTRCLDAWVREAESRAAAVQPATIEPDAETGRSAVVGRATPRESDTATIPAVPADAGRVLVHTAVLAPLAAAATFAGAARAAELAAAVLAGGWLIATVLNAQRRATRRPARHRAAGGVHRLVVARA